MINQFLKAKHWQLFSLMFGIPILFQFLIMGMVFSNTSLGSEPDPTFFFDLMKFFPLIMILYSGLYYGWFWSIAIGLQSKLPKHITMNTRKFKIFFFIPLIYILLICLFFSVFLSGDIQNMSEPEPQMIAGVVGVIIPLHLFSMVGIFYSMYFTAKVYKTVELQKEVGFSDFVGEFFLLWFYPVGIWILQPNINKMAEENNSFINQTF